MRGVKLNWQLMFLFTILIQENFFPSISPSVYLSAFLHYFVLRSRLSSSPRFLPTLTLPVRQRRINSDMCQKKKNSLSALPFHFYFCSPLFVLPLLPPVFQVLLPSFHSCSSLLLSLSLSLSFFLMSLFISFFTYFSTLSFLNSFLCPTHYISLSFPLLPCFL